LIANAWKGRYSLNLSPESAPEIFFQKIGHPSFLAGGLPKAEFSDLEWYRGNLYVLMKPPKASPTSVHLYRMTASPIGSVGPQQLAALAPPGAILEKLAVVEDRLFVIGRDVGSESRRLFELRGVEDAHPGWFELGPLGPFETQAWDFQTGGETLVVYGSGARIVETAGLPPTGSHVVWNRRRLEGGNWVDAMRQLFFELDNARDSSAMVANRFELPGPARIESLEVESETEALPSFRFRTANSEGTPYSEWSQPFRTASLPVNREGQFLQYEILQTAGNDPTTVHSIKIQWESLSGIEPPDSPPAPNFDFSSKPSGSTVDPKESVRFQAVSIEAKDDPALRTKAIDEFTLNDEEARAGESGKRAAAPLDTALQTAALPTLRDREPESSRPPALDSRLRGNDEAGPVAGQGGLGETEQDPESVAQSDANENRASEGDSEGKVGGETERNPTEQSPSGEERGKDSASSQDQGNDYKANPGSSAEETGAQESQGVHNAARGPQSNNSPQSSPFANPVSQNEAETPSSLGTGLLTRNGVGNPRGPDQAGGASTAGPGAPTLAGNQGGSIASGVPGVNPQAETAPTNPSTQPGASSPIDSNPAQSAATFGKGEGAAAPIGSLAPAPREDGEPVLRPQSFPTTPQAASHAGLEDTSSGQGEPSSGFGDPSAGLGASSSGQGETTSGFGDSSSGFDASSSGSSVPSTTPRHSREGGNPRLGGDLLLHDGTGSQGIPSFDEATDTSAGVSLLENVDPSSPPETTKAWPSMTGLLSKKGFPLLETLANRNRKMGDPRKSVESEKNQIGQSKPWWGWLIVFALLLLAALLHRINRSLPSPVRKSSPLAVPRFLHPDTWERKKIEETSRENRLAVESVLEATEESTQGLKTLTQSETFPRLDGKIVWQVAEPLPAPISPAAAFYRNGQVFVADPQGTICSARISSDGALCPWGVQMGRLPKGSSACGIAALDHLLVSHSKDRLHVAGIDEDGVGEWHEVGRVPGISGRPALAGKGDRLYLAGGAGERGNLPLVRSIDFDGKGRALRIEAQSPLPKGISDGSLAVGENRIYWVGGREDSTWTGVVFSARVAANGDLREWVEEPALPVGLRKPTLQIWDDTLWVVGGGHLRNRVFAAPFTASGRIGEWSEIESDLPEPLEGGACLRAGGRFLLLGGRTTQGAAHPNREVYWWSPTTA
jgi:hypothetical protein